MHQIISYTHAGLGTIALVAGLIALIAVKGSRLHIRGGTVFAWMMTFVVVTAMIIMYFDFLPLAIVLALATAYLVPSGILSFNTQVKGFVAWNALLMTLAGALCLFALAQFVRFNLAGDRFVVGPLVLAAMFAWLFAGDWRMLATRPSHPNYWIRRHLARMILAFTVAVMALVRIGVSFGLPFEATVIAPLAIAAIAIVATYRRYPVALLARQD